MISIADTVINIKHATINFPNSSDEVMDLLQQIKTQGAQNFMATQADFDTVLSRIDGATTDIAGDLQALRDQIAGAGLPGDVETTVLAGLDAAASRLEGIATDHDNPVPEPTA